MEIKIIRSVRRKKTVAARLAKDTLFVNAPVSISEGQLYKIIDKFKARFERKRLQEELNKNTDLMAQAISLNKEYFDNKLKINKIEYAGNFNGKFGCCDYRRAYLRISHKLSVMPAWVRNYVIIHEMAHLIQPNHSRAFWDIVGRYELSERARGYLMAVGMHQEEIQNDGCCPGNQSQPETEPSL